MKIFIDSVYIIHIQIRIMNSMFRYINLLAVIAILTGFAMATVHHHDIVIHNGDYLIEIGDPGCSMCDATVKINSDHSSAPSVDLQPVSDVVDGILLSVYIPFEKVTRERAPPARV